MKLVIAEKPSVGNSIAKVIGATDRKDGYLEGNGYIVSWCVGHLVSLAEPDAYDEKYAKWRREDLPIMPQTFRFIVAPDKKKQFKVLKGLMERTDVDELICATDAGREGELIFRLVYKQARCAKPFRRLWISSMEDIAIAEGFRSLKPGSEYDALYRAALCRSEADWIVGMNATRLFSTLYHHRLTVGRVQTPTLAMIVERQNQIMNFKKEKYFNVHVSADGLELLKEKIFSEEEANSLANLAAGEDIIITSVQKTRKTLGAPKLYDLTTLQREANRYFGYTAQQTLDTVQALYEKKLVTYPRTDSQYLTEDMEETARAMVDMLRRMFDFGLPSNGEPDVARIINNAKVTDHHAIIPTSEISRYDRMDLSEKEIAILKLIAQQLLCATGRKHIYEETEVIGLCAGEEYRAKGKIVLEAGWKAVEAAYKGRNEKNEDEKTLPDVQERQILAHAESKVTEHFTSPPKAYTEDSLLKAMETAGNEDFDEDTEKKGLGTPATRASIIEKLVHSRYVQRKGKQLIPTEDGINLIAVMPEDVKSAKLTAEWENTLMQIERRNTDADAFMRGIDAMVRDLIAKNAEVPEENKQRFGNAFKKEAIGVCPRCGDPVFEGQKNFYCSSKECRFCIWKESKWLSSMNKTVDARMAAALLKDGRVFVNGLWSAKKKRAFDAELVLDDTGEHVNFKLEFPNQYRR